jgi:integrase
MTGHLHLYRRDSRYWWRRRLPTRIAFIIGRSHATCALRTADPHLARIRCRRLTSLFDRYFSVVLCLMESKTWVPSKALVIDLLQSVYDHILDERELARALAPPENRMADVTGPDLDEDGPGLPIPQTNEESQDEQWAIHMGTPDYELGQLQESLYRNDCSFVEPILTELLAARSIQADPTAPQFRLLARRAMVAAINALKEDMHRDSGDYSNADWVKGAYVPSMPSEIFTHAANPSPLLTPAPPPPKAVEKPISAYFDEYISAHRKNWTPQTESQNLTALQLLKGIAGDIAPSDISRGVAETIHNTLEKLPANMGKSSRHRDATIEQVIRAKSKDTLTLSLGTLDRHWRAIKAFYQWLNRNSIVDVDLDRVFGGLQWSDAVPDPRGRSFWDDNSVDRLLNSPIWTGCVYSDRSRHIRHEPGNRVVQDEYWWLPIIGLFHGGRLEELAAMTGERIFDIDGIPVMWIPRLKTSGSERIVPIHPFVIQCGFLNLVQSSGPGRIFPKVLSGGRDNRVGYEYTQDFTEYRKKIDVYTKLMDFQSFRTTVSTRMVHANVSMLIVDEITGHDSKQRKEVKEHQSISLNYVAPHDIKLRRDALANVTYPGARLDHLRHPDPILITGREGGDEVRKHFTETRRSRRTKGARRRTAIGV